MASALSTSGIAKIVFCMFLSLTTSLRTAALLTGRLATSSCGLANKVPRNFNNFRMKKMSNFAAESLSSSALREPVESDSTVVHNAFQVSQRIHHVAIEAGRDPDGVRLIAVSKTKPASDIQALYNAGHRHFGENYFQELLDKAAQLPADIQWHFIGHLQSAKSNKLIKDVPNLAVLETLDSSKLAGKLNNACVLAEREKLSVYIQVDTSGETTKSGISLEELNELLGYIQNECPRLTVAGLMTIGAPGDLSCFDKLVSARDQAAAFLGVDASSMELSMGMSGDYEEAIRRGATSVRVGSTIFGARLYPQKN